MYRLICMEMKKIIKSLGVVFFEDKTHLEDCPSGKLIEYPRVKVDISSKLDVEDLDVSDNILEQDCRTPC